MYTCNQCSIFRTVHPDYGLLLELCALTLVSHSYVLLLHEIVTVGDYRPGSGSALWTPWVMFTITWQQWEEQLHRETLPWDAITHTHTVWIRSAAIWLPPSPNHHGTHTQQEQGIIWNVFCAQYSSFVFRDMWFTGWAYIGTHVQSCLHQTDKYKQYTHFVSGNYTALYKWFTHKGQLDRSCTIKFWFRLLCLDWLKSDQSEL